MANWDNQKVDVKGFEQGLKVENDPDPVDEQLTYVRAVLEGIWDAFTLKYAEYGEGAADALGLAGQWGDLHRKVMKLKRSLWVGDSGYLVSEDERQILADMVGHCLLAIHMIDRGLLGGRR
jgi:hypothetical protein